MLDGLSQTCVASASVEEMCDAMRNFIGEEAVAEALRLSEMLFEKKKDYQEEEKKTNSPSSSSFRDDGELKLRKVKEKTKTTSDGDGGKEEDQKKGEAKAYRKYDSIEKPSCTNDQTSSKATNSVVREHRSVLVKMSKKKSGGEDVGKRKDRMKKSRRRSRGWRFAQAARRELFAMREDFFDSIWTRRGRSAENDARVFLESSGKCTFCDAFVNVKLRDGLVWNGGIGYATEQEQEEDTEGGKAAAERLKDQLVSFDRSGASRTKVVDDQSEWYDHGGRGRGSVVGRGRAKSSETQTRHDGSTAERERVGEKKETFGIDILGRKTMILDEEELQLIRERDERAKLAMESAALNSMSEFAQGGGSAVATAAETARELESRTSENRTTDVGD